MSVFVVVLPEENSDVVARLDKKYSGFQEITPTVFLVSSKKLSERVANDLGLKGENRVSPDGGVVFRLRDMYAGRASPSVWEWLKGKEEKF